MKQEKTTPKVPMSFRLSPELKETLKGKATLNDVKPSDYLSQLLEKNFSDKDNSETTDLSDLSKLIIQKRKERKLFFELCENEEIPPQKTIQPSKPQPKSKLEYTKENNLIVHIDPYSKNEYHRYLDHLRKKYGGADSDIILAALVAATENRRAIIPKPFEYYLDEQLNQQEEYHIQSIEEIDFSILLKYIGGIIIFFFVFNRLFKWSKS